VTVTGCIPNVLRRIESRSFHRRGASVGSARHKKSSNLLCPSLLEPNE
jgi:hypothetical protein